MPRHNYCSYFFG